MDLSIYRGMIVKTAMRCYNACNALLLECMVWDANAASPCQACAWTVSKAKGLTRRGHACIPHSCVCSVVIMISRSDHHVIMDKNNLECYLEGPCACDAAGSPNG